MKNTPTSDNLNYARHDIDHILIRPLEKRDINACRLIYESTKSDHKSDFILQQELESVFEETKFIKPVFIIAEDITDNSIVGFAAYSKLGCHEDIYNLMLNYVSPHYQGRGLGLKLIETRLNQIKSLGGRIVLASVKRHYQLERFGFDIIDKINEDWFLLKLTFNLNFSR